MTAKRLAWGVWSLCPKTYSPVALYGEHPTEELALAHVASIAALIQLPLVIAHGPAELPHYDLPRNA